MPDNGLDFSWGQQPASHSLRLKANFGTAESRRHFREWLESGAMDFEFKQTKRDHPKLGQIRALFARTELLASDQQILRATNELCDAIAEYFEEHPVMAWSLILGHPDGRIDRLCGETLQNRVRKLLKRETHRARSNPNVVGPDLVYRVMLDPDNQIYYVDGYEPPGPAPWGHPSHADGVYIVGPTGARITSAAQMARALAELMWRAPIDPPLGGHVIFITPLGRFAWDGHFMANASPDNPRGLPRENPRGLSAKGERMYKHIRDSYVDSGYDRVRAEELAARTVLARARSKPALGLRNNPGEPAHVPDLEMHVESYERFNHAPHNRVSQFERAITVPAQLPLCGRLKYMMYASKKVLPGSGDKGDSHDYFHETGRGVKVLMPGCGGPMTKIPKTVRDADTLAAIGERALGFCYLDEHGEEVELKVPRGTRWFWSERARAFYGITGYRKLACVIFGGSMRVEPRGIVG